MCGLRLSNISDTFDVLHNLYNCMNIGELCHRQEIIGESDFINHSPTFIITEKEQFWYFPSINCKTLRKRP